jgi:hypothetical protein
MKLEFSEEIFEKSSNVTFHEYPSSGSRIAFCEQMNEWTDMTKQIVTFRNFAIRGEKENLIVEGITV